MRKYLTQIKEGIIDQNPTFIQFLGMCPTLAVTTSVSNAIGMGLAATAVLICSNVLISLLRKFIPAEVRIASYIVIISGFVTAVELLMKAFMEPLYNSLGLYIPLIVVNCIILARAEAFASKNPVLPSAVDGLAMGLGFTVSLTVIGSVREILGAGSWLGLPIPGISQNPAIIFILPAGAFLTLGMLTALVNFLRRYAEEHPRPRLQKIDPTELIPDSEVTAEDSVPQNMAGEALAEAEMQAAAAVIASAASEKAEQAMSPSSADTQAQEETPSEAPAVDAETAVSEETEAPNEDEETETEESKEIKETEKTETGKKAVESEDEVK